VNSGAGPLASGNLPAALVRARPRARGAVEPDAIVQNPDSHRAMTREVEPSLGGSRARLHDAIMR
jgi:hypothetical protein